jgi:Circularly permutated YpsA SLOG family
MIQKIISGGQTGADRAGLDVAIELGIPHGGWIPKGRKTEDGTLPEKYHLREMPTSSYPKRTEQNIVDSDGTIVFSYGPLSGGSALTARLSKKHGKPLLYIDLDKIDIESAAKDLRGWLSSHRIKRLNVAGSRASKSPDIYKSTFGILALALKSA